MHRTVRAAKTEEHTLTGRPKAPSKAAGADQPRRRGWFMPRLRDARIRSKLGIILLIPLIAVAALAVLRLVDSGERALSAELVRSLAVVSAEAGTVSHELHRERVAAIQLLSDPEGDATQFGDQAASSDAAVARYQTARSELGDVPDVVEARLIPVDEHVASLGEIRQQVLDDQPITELAAALRYGVIVTDVLAYQEAVGQVADDPSLAEEIRAMAAFARAKTLAGEAEALSWVAVAEGEFDAEQQTAFLATLTGQQEAQQTFAQAATPEQQEAVSTLLTGGPTEYLDNTATDVVAGGITPDKAANTFLSTVELMRQAEIRIQDLLLASATQLRDNVFQQVLIESVAVLVALLIAIAVAVLLARMLARSLGQLRENALAVAERDLPETVARLSDPRTLGENTPAQLAAQVREPIQLRSRDEIGQVAQAFNVVHRAAVRVAAEQAALRTSVSAMFLNLARRSQSLVDRMISQLDEIERHEEDPKRLARMFTLDHLATRMRRNDENLLVLAGADSSPPRTEDALVTDVLRAAQSEVEHYDRIEFGTVDSDVSVISHSVNDVVRLVAELFDNATRFSPPDAAVVCEARRLGDQVIVQIEDRGVGMAQDQVNRLNAWLASPPAVEVTTFRKMGLAVVARLAARHQVRVELRCDPNYGTIAYVALPRSILLLPRSRLRGVEMPAPRSPLPVERAPANPPPVPSRHLGQLPRRSPAVAHHAAGRRSSRGQLDGQPTMGNLVLGNGAPQSGPTGDAGRVDLPVAGRPLYELTAHQNATPPPPPPHHPATPPPEATVELPIFREMEAVWFRSHGDLDLGRQAQTPSAGSYPAPSSSPPVNIRSVPSAPPAPPPPEPPAPSRYEDATTPASWRTAADFGWRAAAAASQPTSGGATESGLPKRVPQAQLVPGSVDAPAAGATQRRSPEEIRGLLSAYHRGVQRGRESGGR
jgi:signal transduction histidine kinase